MLSEIQSEFDKVKEKDLSVKKFVNSSISDLRKELLNFKKDLEDQKNSMTVFNLIIILMFVNRISPQAKLLLTQSIKPMRK